MEDLSIEGKNKMKLEFKMLQEQDYVGVLRNTTFKRSY